MWSNEIDAVDAKKEFVKFLEEYDEEHACEFSAESGRHTIDLDKLRKYCDNKDKKDLITKILDEPATYLTSLASAVEEFESQRNTGLKGVSKQSEVKICLKGNFGSRSISPRDLLSHYIEKIVSVKGIVTKCTAVRPKLTKITQFCSETNKFSHRTYRDATTLRGAPTSLAISARDETGNQLTTEYGLSSYSDQQCITIQEMPEHSPSGQLPRSVEVVLEDDLVDTCKPGDRVNIVGVYKVLPSRLPNMALGGTFRTLLVAIGITQLSGEISVPDLTSTDHAIGEKRS
jgi:DNA replication licensing factor MCM3